MWDEPFDVAPYSIERLLDLLATESDTAKEDVEDKLHSAYFEDYFGEIGTSTIVVERNYVDHDFLEDFAKYYVKCFASYRRFCTRLHFFSHEFSAEDLQSLFLGAQSPVTFSDLHESYLGFLIVKPIPETLVGRTCLACYDADNGRRYYPTTRSYEAHLFGHKFTVKSLAFQEQDTVVAACATSALWSAFHATGKLFQHSIPSPVEITEAAQVAYDVETRAFPNEGLTLSQMAQSIRSVSLEPRLINVKDETHVLKANAYAYVKGQIPLLLTACIEDHGTSPAATLGAHALAVTGFSLAKATPDPLATTGLLLRATRIDKLYAHDDQVGPFARMEFATKGLTTSWRSPTTGRMGDVFATPLELLVPEYNKVRIPFDVVHDAVVAFDEFIESLRIQSFLSLSSRLEWDIYLALSNDVKANLQQGSRLTHEYLAECLFEPMPRFVWRATALDGAKAVLDLLFDATDIPQGKFFLRAVEYDTLLSIVLRVVCKDDSLIDAFKRDRAGRVLEWFKSQPLPTS